MKEYTFDSAVTTDAPVPPRHDRSNQRAPSRRHAEGVHQHELRDQLGEVGAVPGGDVALPGPGIGSSEPAAGTVAAHAAQGLDTLPLGDDVDWYFGSETAFVEPAQWGHIRIVGNAYANSGDPG